MGRFSLKPSVSSDHKAAAPELEPWFSCSLSGVGHSCSHLNLGTCACGGCLPVGAEEAKRRCGLVVGLAVVWKKTRCFLSCPPHGRKNRTPIQLNDWKSLLPEALGLALKQCITKQIELHKQKYHCYFIDCLKG